MPRLPFPIKEGLPQKDSLSFIEFILFSNIKYQYPSSLAITRTTSPSIASWIGI